MRKIGIDDEYSFEKYVVGNCNKFAVADEPEWIKVTEIDSIILNTK